MKFHEYLWKGLIFSENQIHLAQCRLNRRCLQSEEIPMVDYRTLLFHEKEETGPTQIQRSAAAHGPVWAGGRPTETRPDNERSAERSAHIQYDNSWSKAGVSSVISERIVSLEKVTHSFSDQWTQTVVLGKKHFFKKIIYFFMTLSFHHLFFQQWMFVYHVWLKEKVVKVAVGWGEGSTSSSSNQF